MRLAPPGQAPGHGDPLDLRCPKCDHPFVFYDAAHTADLVTDRADCWAVCDACLWSTPTYQTPEILLRNIANDKYKAAE